MRSFVQLTQAIADSDGEAANDDEVTISLPLVSRKERNNIVKAMDLAMAIRDMKNALPDGWDRIFDDEQPAE